MSESNSVPTFDQIVSALNQSENAGDKELAEIFTRHETIRKTYNACLDFVGGDAENVGVRFHKSFRQTDVVRGDKGKTDMRVWHLLHETETFWNCLSPSFRCADVH